MTRAIETRATAVSFRSHCASKAGDNRRRPPVSRPRAVTLYEFARNDRFALLDNLVKR